MYLQSKKKVGIGSVFALLMALLITSLVLADTIRNSVNNAGDSTITVNGSTVIKYWVQSQGGDNETGCNATIASPLSLTINTPAGVTASPASLTFTACGNSSSDFQNVTFSSNAVGNYAITHSWSDSGSGNYTNNANFTLYVEASADANAPTVMLTVPPVTGSNGWFKTNPVTLQVAATDTNPVTSLACTIDGSPVSFSSISGLGSSSVSASFNVTLEGISNVSCSATDASNNQSNAATAVIYIDSVAPVISAAVSPALPASGWYNLASGAPTVTYICTDGNSSVASCTPDHTFAEGSGQSHTGTAVDVAGNSASATVSGINIDKTAPSVSASASPAANANGWNNTDVTVSYSGSDSLSGIDSCDAADALSSEGAGQSASGTCTDKAGNSATASASGINIDKTAPSVSASASPAPNGKGWNNTDVTVSYSGSDSLSGIDLCDAATVLSSEGAGQSASGTCTDKAGNTASDTQSGINIDKTDPVIAYVSRTAANGNGWNNGNVTVNWSCSDILSSPVAASVSEMVSTQGLDQSATGTCEDLAGNTALDTQSGINIDKTDPVIAYVSRTAANGNGWNNGNVTVNWSCSDILSSPVAASVSEMVSTQGLDQSATGTCEDLAGNTASDTQYGINIDKTAPSVSASVSPTANANGWNNTDVTVSYSGSDSLSGIDSCDDATVLSSEGSGQSATGTCTDKAGNSASATASGINIDKTKPIVAVTGLSNGAFSTLGSVPAAGCSTTDALSGVATGATLSTSGGPVGLVTATCSGAADKAGNTAADVSVTYSVIYNWTGFFRPIDNLPTINQVKAGSAIPVKFSLSGSQGLSIFTVGFPKSGLAPCDASAPVDAIEETVTAGSSSLSYDATTDTYNYVWKTDKSWAGTCHQLQVKLIDGTTHIAAFKFTK